MTTQFNIKKAKREKIWTKVAIMGSSGSGKTYSALRLATGMLEKLKDLKMEQNGRILMINTEQKRGYYYAIGSAKDNKKKEPLREIAYR